MSSFSPFGVSMFVMIWWAILWKAMALELTNDEAWVSIDSAGNLEHHRYGEEEQAELPEVETGRMGDLETESRLMRRSSRSSSRSKHARDQVKQARPDILEEVPMAQLRELGEEWRNSLMSNSSGSGDFRWGSGGLTQGAAGPKGEKGIKGKTGPNGKQGPQGPKGDQGAQGEKGPVGELGPIQDMKPPPEGLASASAVGALIFFNLVSAGIVYAVASGQMEKKGGGDLGLACIIGQKLANLENIAEMKKEYLHTAVTCSTIARELLKVTPIFLALVEQSTLSETMIRLSRRVHGG